MAKTMVQECFSEIGKRFSKMERSLKRLPYDAELEYLEFPDKSSISEYAKIVLPIYVVSCIDMYAEWYLPNGGTRQDSAFIGKWTSSGSNLINVTTGNKFSIWNGTSSQINAATVVPIGQWFSVSLSGNTATCNETSYTTNQSNFVVREPMIIQGSCNCRMRRIIFSLCGITLLDFVPVKLNNVGYFFDKVSNQFYGTANSTNFILGPDK